MHRRLLALLPALALAAAACGSNTDGAVTATEARASGGDGSWVECENAEEGYVLSRPADWHVGDTQLPCSAMDADQEPLAGEPEARSEAAVLIEHQEVPFDTAAASPPEGEEVVSAERATVDGRDAVRRETRAGDRSDLPEGTRITRWTVDLRAGRALVARTTDLGGADYHHRQDVLDRMVTSARWFEPGTTDEGRDPVGEPTAGPIASDDYPRSGAEPSLLSDVRAESHDGFDRIVVELTGAEVPSYRVAEIAPPIGRDDSDGATPVAGEAFLEIRLSPAGVLDPSGARSYQGPDRITVADGAIVTEVVRTGGTEGPLAFAVGLESSSPFAVGVRDDPARLVVDIVPEG